MFLTSLFKVLPPIPFTRKNTNITFRYPTHIFTFGKPLTLNSYQD